MSRFISLIIALVVVVAAVNAAQPQPPPVDPYSKEAYVPVSPITNADFYADFCVIGAGFAGVKAVETLVVQGNVNSWLIIEAQNRIGGRVQTVPVGGSMSRRTPSGSRATSATRFSASARS